AFDPSGTKLVSGDDNGAVVVRNTETGRVLGTWSDGAAVTAVAFPRRGNSVVTGDEQGRAVLRDTRRLVTSTALGSPVVRLGFSADGSVLAAFTLPRSINQLGHVTRWDLTDGAQEPLAEVSETPVMATSADGRFVVTTQPMSDAARRTAIVISS